MGAIIMQGVIMEIIVSFIDNMLPGWLFGELSGVL